MHENVAIYCESIRDKFPAYFKNKYVLDCGSLDINGNNRPLFEKCFYLGVDRKLGKNVHVLSLIHKIPFTDSIFDVVLSTNAFEHDRHWRSSLNTMVRVLKPGGLMFFACGREWHAHGTYAKSPEASPHTNDYYLNLTEKHIRRAIFVDEIFTKYEFGTSDDGLDLFFWGVKL